MNKLQSVSLILLFVVSVLAVPALWKLIQTQYPLAAVSLSELMLASIILGSAATALMGMMKGSNQEKRLSNWQTQDAKLIAEIKSDREKQLEAKVATLETALKSSLKKG